MCNDKCKQLMNIYKNLNGDFTNEVKEVINEWELNKWSKNEFLKSIISTLHTMSFKNLWIESNIDVYSYIKNFVINESGKN